MEHAVVVEGIQWIRELGPYGPVVVVAVLYFADKWGWIGKGKKNESGTKESIDKLRENVDTIARQTDALHRWHDKEDGDGVKLWYVRPSLEEAIHKLSDNIEIQTTLLRELVLQVKRTDSDVLDVKRKVGL